MKAITMWQPWATWVELGFKTIETRTHARFMSLAGQRIAIHAGKHYDNDARKLAAPYLTPGMVKMTNIIGGLVGFTHGQIVAVVTVTASRVLTAADSQASLIDASGRYGLVLADRIRLGRPVATRGQMGIWELSEEAEREVLAQLEAGAR